MARSSSAGVADASVVHMTPERPDTDDAGFFPYCHGCGAVGHVWRFRTARGRLLTGQYCGELCCLIAKVAVP